MTLTLLAVAMAVALLPGRGASWSSRACRGSGRPAAGGFSVPALRRLRGGGDRVADTDVAAWASAVAADCRAGSEPLLALTQACDRLGVAPRAAAAAAVGGDVTAALGSDAARCGSRLLGEVAVAWGVRESGAGLADLLDGIVLGHRESAAVRRALAQEVAGPRATVRLMAFLPLGGLALAYLFGADPLEWLVSNPVGWAVAAGGVLLNVVGHLWTRHILRSVEEML